MKDILVHAQVTSRWSVQPSWPSRLPLRWWVDQQPKRWVIFISLLSLLAFSTMSLLLQTLKASSTKVDSWVCDPASSFCNFLQVAGVALVEKFTANSVLFSAGSRAVLVPFLNASVTPLRKTARFSSFSIEPFRPYHNLQASPYSLSFW